MHIYSKNQVAKPIVTPHGETIYEILGRVTGEPTNLHSVAIVTLEPGKESVLHYHPIAEESYYILSGKAKVMVGDEVADLEKGQIVNIPPTKKHQIKNTGDEMLQFMAICVPAWELSNTVWL